MTIPHTNLNIEYVSMELCYAQISNFLSNFHHKLLSYENGSVSPGKLWDILYRIYLNYNNEEVKN
jgi:hypothetical protein